MAGIIHSIPGQIRNDKTANIYVAMYEKVLRSALCAWRYAA